MPDYPVIKCLPRCDVSCVDMLRFWCPFCKRWHYHGRTDGHRVAHCVGQTPYKRSGYEIKMMSKKELRNIRKAIDAYLKNGGDAR